MPRSLQTLIASLLLLFGLVSGCNNNPASTSPNPTITDPIEQFDTGVSDTNVDTAVLDAATQALIDQGIRFDSWVAIMDPFMTTNQDWTFTFNEPAFLASINTTYPEVVAYYEGTGPATDDTVVIDELLNGLPIANQFVLGQYNELTQNGTVAPPPSIYGAWYWWGYKESFTGTDAYNMLWSMYGGTSRVCTYLPSPIGAITCAVLGGYYAWAASENSYYGGFSICVSPWYTYGIRITISTP